MNRSRTASIVRGKSFGGFVVGGLGWLLYSRYPQYFAGTVDKATFVGGCFVLGAGIEGVLHRLLGLNTPGPPGFVAVYSKVLLARGLLALKQLDEATYKRIQEKAVNDYFFDSVKPRTRRKQLDE